MYIHILCQARLMGLSKSSISTLRLFCAGTYRKYHRQALPMLWKDNIDASLMIKRYCEEDHAALFFALQIATYGITLTNGGTAFKLVSLEATAAALAKWHLSFSIHQYLVTIVPSVKKKSLVYHHPKKWIELNIRYYHVAKKNPMLQSRPMVCVIYVWYVWYLWYAWYVEKYCT